MWIETIMHMSGTRANGDRYPPGFTPFEVADWEGEHLIRGGMAREVAAPRAARPAPVPPPVPPEPLAPVPGMPGYDPGSAPEMAPGPGPALPLPAPADPKQAWVDYAISQGVDVDTATRMTKADLQSRYGGRL